MFILRQCYNVFFPILTFFPIKVFHDKVQHPQVITKVSVEITKTTHSLNEIKYFQLVVPNILDVTDWVGVRMPLGNRKTVVCSPLGVNVLPSLVMF